MEITSQYFYERTGELPEQDDIERSNCSEAGTAGHYYCGWCKYCDLPKFVCGHTIKNG